MPVNSVKHTGFGVSLSESASMNLLLKNGTCVTPSGTAVADIGIVDGRIAAIGTIGTAAAEVIDCRGLHVLPGVIDSQVHFREPGLEHKEDIATGTAAAALGGVTAVFEMPNTRPATTTAALLADKCRRAKGRAWVDMAFFVGASAENVVELATLERLPGCAGIKLFMGSSTGDLLVPDDATIAQVLANGNRRVAVHAEDERRLKERYTIVEGGADVGMHPEWRDVETALAATRRLLALAQATRRRVHVLHVTTAEELPLLAEHRTLATVEVTPQHLTLAAPECYRELDGFAQMNPPIREGRHRAALWAAVANGLVDCIGSDHAPHTRDEKNQPYPGSPSGMPGVQTLVPVLLNHVAEGRLSLERFVDLTSTGPARIFGIAGAGRIALGYPANLTVVDLKHRRMITHLAMASRCGWTPFDGLTVTGWPVMTLVRGRIVMREGALLGDPAGEAVRFLECL
ncbi:MAG: dihydroorotase [Rhodospirillales bacterium]|nr:MAG: dihydroorotase [Rhodospirillales bacterium]